jgi:peptide/nickel transport system permease protein
MMAEGRQYIGSAWWIAFFPGVMVVVITAAANLLGDGLNQLVDPRQRREM